MLAALITREALLLWVQHHGPLGLFALLVLGIVGLPVPDEFLLTSAGFLAYKGHMHLPTAMLAAFAGSVCGITVSFGIGKALGHARIERFGHRFGVGEHLVEVREWFGHSGKWVLMFGYFVPGLRHFSALIAGASELPLKTFAVFAYVGALLWSQAFILLGFMVGDGWRSVEERVSSGLMRVSIAIAAAVVVYVAWHFFLRYSLRRLRASVAARRAARHRAERTD